MPARLGGGERLFDDAAGVAERYDVSEVVGSPSVLHVRLTRS